MPTRKTPLYSPSRRGTAPAVKPAVAAVQPPSAPAGASPAAGPAPVRMGFFRRHRASMAWSGLSVVLAVAAMMAVLALQPAQRVITQKHIDAAVRHTLEKEPLPSPAAKAYGRHRTFGGAWSA